MSGYTHCRGCGLPHSNGCRVDVDGDGLCTPCYLKAEEFFRARAKTLGFGPATVDGPTPGLASHSSVDLWLRRGGDDF